jgi:hypothetical protein
MIPTGVEASFLLATTVCPVPMLLLVFRFPEGYVPPSLPSLNMLILRIVSSGRSPLGVVGLLISGIIPSGPPTMDVLRRCLVCSCSCAVLLKGEAI